MHSGLSQVASTRPSLCRCSRTRKVSRAPGGVAVVLMVAILRRQLDVVNEAVVRTPAT
jgi:hypothetical protein